MNTPSSGSTRGKTALLLAPEAPYPATGGGSLRTACLIEYLAARYDLDVIVFREPASSDPRCAFPVGLARRVDTIELPRHSNRALPWAGRNAARYLLGRPPFSDRFAGFGARLSELLGRHRYDLAVVEHFWCAPYVEQLARCAGRVVLDLHNIDSAFYGRSAESERWLPAALAMRRFASTCGRLEARWLPRCSLILAASEQDAELARLSAASTPVRVFPNAIPWVARPEEPEENAIVFSGNFEYRPNIAAVRHFRYEVWPLLREKWPGLVWRLIGKNHEAVARHIASDDRIEATGPVADAVQALARARVVVVPLLAGSATRVKILEAWAAGRAVVSTAVGAEGLGAGDGREIVIADGALPFAGSVSALLASPEKRERLGAAGRALFEARYTWNRAWDILATIGI